MHLPRSRRTLRLAALLLALPVVSACSVVVGPDGEWGDAQRELSRARRTWQANFIDDYEYVVRRTCYCVYGGVAVRVIVRDDYVVALYRESTGEPISLGYAAQYPTIDGILARIQYAIDQRAWRVEAIYDYQYGFPTDVYIDYDERAADEEEGYELLAFREWR